MPCCNFLKWLQNTVRQLFLDIYLHLENLVCKKRNPLEITQRPKYLKKEEKKKLHDVIYALITQSTQFSCKGRERGRGVGSTCKTGINANNALCFNARCDNHFSIDREACSPVLQRCAPEYPI